MSEKEVILDIKDLELWFKNDYDESFKILNKISFQIHKGETLGIVGESGCGKSLTSLSIMRLVETPPAIMAGSICFCGQELMTLSPKEMQKIRGNRISMIFQEPMTSLNPVYTIGNQLEETFMLHQKLSRKEARQQAIEMLRLARVSLPEQRMDEYPFQLSGGMRQRVMIAMALSCRPELLIADEPTTALDVTIQAQVLHLMRELKKELGTAIAFITHDLGVIKRMCDRVIVMYCGEIMEEASVRDIFLNPRHPYTEGLLSTLPKFGQTGKLKVIPGMVPKAGDFPTGCVFSTRCEFCTERCRAEKPGFYSVAEGHQVRCFRYENGGEA